MNVDNYSPKVNQKHSLLTSPKVINCRASSSSSTNLFSVDITSGRPHQIRIHLACVGHPLVGDPLYDVGGTIRANPGLPGDGGYLLHAEWLSFAHPITGHTLQLQAPAPATLRTVAEASLIPSL